MGHARFPSIYRSFLGRKGAELIEKLDLEVSTSSELVVQVANGQVELVTEEVLVPMELKLRARLRLDYGGLLWNS